MTAYDRLLTALRLRRFHYLGAQMRAWSFEILFILSLIAALTAVLSWEGTAKRPYYYTWSTDRTPVELQMHDDNRTIRFLIPRAYLRFSEDAKGGLTDSFSMYVIYPEMQPLSGTNKSTADPDVLSILLVSHYSSGGKWTTRKVIDGRLSDDWTRVERVGAAFDVYVSRRDLSRWNNKTTSLVTEYLVPIDRQPDQGIYFSCFREPANPGVGCSGFVTFGKNIELDWVFRRNRLEEWPEMLSKVEDFLKSLMRS
jgi:hypothetical protein